MSKQQIQGNLARLLATENLTVEHRKIPTAYFNIEKRVLALPMWKEMSDSVYTMLVGHEVGHALYTPQEWIEEEFECPKSYVNIIEDARVEKLMKRRYPGLKSQFFTGYKELNDKNFFEVNKEELPGLILIDRINLHFKIGSSLSVPFSDEEMVWVNRTATVETWEEVVDLANELYAFMSQQKQETPAPTSSQDKSETPSNGDQVQSMENDSKEITEDSQDNLGESEDADKSDADLDTPSYEHDDFESVTDEALTRNQQQLIDELSKENVYVELPELNLDNIIVPHNNINKNLTKWISEPTSVRAEFTEVWINRYRNYKKESTQEVNYMIKEFEMKKSADMYRRSSTSKTGVLDTQRLHSYKFNDDIFKKVTTCPEGKNHGLIFYVDWSGSMGNLLEKTIRQLYSLLWFCQKSQIPFRVYAFSNSYIDEFYNFSDEKDYFYKSVKENDINICKNFRLLELFSSKMNAKTLNDQMEKIYAHVCAVKSYYDCCMNLQLGGTPLIEASVTVPQIIDLFKKQESVQKTNVIFLTDGEGCGLTVVKKYDGHLGSSSCWYHHYHNYILRDRKKCKSQNIDVSNRELSNIQIISFVNKIVDANILCFRIVARRDLTSYLRAITNFNIDMNKVDSIWKKESAYTLTGCGFDEFYLISEGKMEETEEFNIDTEKKSHSKREILTKFKKHMGKRRTNKMILSNFISQIA